MKDLLNRFKKSTRFQLSIIVVALIPLVGIALALKWIDVDAFQAVTTLAGVAVGTYIGSETVDKVIKSKNDS